MDTEIEALRRAAPSWSLADDQRLLDALQKLHETLLTRCNHTNGQLSTMCTAFTDAALALDNVNNRFMSLSNRQFVERRVYDDDADVTTPAGDVAASQKSNEQLTPVAESTADNIKRALRVLENMHESVVILADSDSDSGSDGDGDVDRVVLKPKDVYRDRPLPYILGSKAWKSKWHAGVLPDESGSDSGDSDASRDFEEYSDNERYSPSESELRKDIRPVIREEISTSSSEVVSEQDMPSAAFISQKQSPADIAAELARRLQPQSIPTPVQPPQSVIEDSPPQQVPRKLYKPEKPLPATIFPDEPPPLDSSSDHEDDIFAELRKNKTHVHSVMTQNSVAKDLFGVRGTDDADDGSEQDGDIFSDFVPKAKNKTNPSPAVKQTVSPSPMKPETQISEPSLPVTVTSESNEQPPAKKPVGGISLFGGGHHSALGAAILQRQRQAAFSDDTDESDAITAPKETNYKPETQEESKNKNIEQNTQKDIFEDLFAKSEKVNAKKKASSPIVKENTVETIEKKTDLFSDSLFDDIDDIFTSNIVTKVPIKEADTRNSGKSLFDDEDELFRDIAVTNTSGKQNESIFDSDDDLFSDKPLQILDQNSQKISNNQNNNVSERTCDNGATASKYTMSNASKDTRSIFDTDEDLFVENKPYTKLTEAAKESQVANEKVAQIRNKTISIFDDSDDDMFLGTKSIKSKEETTKAQLDDFGAKSKIILGACTIKDQGIFKDEYNVFQDKRTNIKSEQNNTTGKFKNDDVLFKISSKVTTKENINDLDEKQSKQMILNPNLIGDKHQITKTKQLAENVSTSEDLSSNEFQSSNFQDNIDVLKESNSQKSDAEHVLEEKDNFTRHKPGEPKESTKVKRNHENVTVKSEGTHRRLNVQFDDDDQDVFESVSDKEKKMPFVTAKDIKPEISRKPTLETNQTVTKKSKEKKTSVGEKTDNAKTHEDKVDNMNVVDSNKNITSNETIAILDTSPCDSILNTPDIFREILNDQPPVFEKPKEHKRSKNINALFDDDSDDEALFYRKSDATLDDIPSVDKKDSSSDDRFQLFFDEPPAVDEDFVENTNKRSSEDKEHNCSCKDVSINETSKSLKLVSDDTGNKTSDNENKENSNIFEHNPEVNSTVTNTNNSHGELFTVSKTAISNEEIFTPKTKSAEAELFNIEMPDSQKQRMVTKNVGKLKPFNLNINVNTLLPGALPKKTVKSQEQTDGQRVSTQPTEELHTNVTINNKEMEPSLVKSVSFEGYSDLTVLDNKLSKERAKIKGKRRPSSRRARHEAARISGIDFGQDSTDNSSSIDDILQSSDSTSNSCTTESKEENLDSITSDYVAEDSKNNTGEANINIMIETSNNSVVDDDKKEIDNSDKRIEGPSKDVKSKVVYIINDEDIFDSKPQTSIKNIDISKPKILNTVNDDIFKSITPANKVENVERKGQPTTIKTLGNVYKSETNNDSDDDIFKDIQNFKKKVSKPIQTMDKLEVKSVEVLSKREAEVESKPKKSIFDDLSDEENELFNTKQKQTLPEKKHNKNILFDSDSESELFSRKRKKDKGDTGAARKDDKERLVVKGALFGDDDDDDLFAAKPKNKTASSLTSSSHSTRNESGLQTQSSSTDPLSALLNPE